MTSERQIRTAYVSDHPDVLCWWEEVETGYRAHQDRITAFLVDFPGREMLGVHGVRGISVSGITGTTDPGVGWRQGRGKSAGWVPAKSTPEGKALAKRLADLDYRRAATPGQPLNTLADGYLCNAAVRMLEGRVWATWRCWSDLVDSKVDHELWTRTPLADYWAAAEVVDEMMRKQEVTK